MAKQIYLRLQECLSLLLTKAPSLEMIADYEENRSEALQEFCINHLKPDITWATGLGVIEAAHHIVEEAIGNTNLDESGDIR